VVQWPSAPPVNPRNTMPTLLIWGARDVFRGRELEYTNLATSAGLSRFLKHARTPMQSREPRSSEQPRLATRAKSAQRRELDRFVALIANDTAPQRVPAEIADRVRQVKEIEAELARLQLDKMPSPRRTENISLSLR
jgi:hypothetical protein